ncbi:DUF1615 domain-containing protein [Crenobacter sp. SG2303]|uniref:DUF1615 domain-containing protein n=1 Tax=Crenobacter oryzisoli TaxID=3056844 RepID=A0ABT7XK69_9NEIS|nr:DUF1615 domain-containing protein [Crenobacter sp. SG2303]MDN0074185.1 DUF1615 domain-containing protein [Crenobacter sp. SG2303]
MSYRSLLVAPLLASLLVACATRQPPAPITPPVPEPAASEPFSVPMPPEGLDIVPSPPPPSVAKPATAPPAWRDEKQGRVLLNQLLPHYADDRKGWLTDIMGAFTALKIPYTPEYFCAVIAVADQESNLQSDPTMARLPQIVWGEIQKRADKYHIPMVVVETALRKTSPDGRTYKERIDTLRTKRQMNALYEDMVRELPFSQTAFEHKNPIRDGGPMQVSVAFAESHVKVWPFPYQLKTSLRDEVFTRRGSVYFGTAILLQYPAPYTKMIYRFADFNAGRYASRNAAFQAAVARLTGRKLALDGDLLLYNPDRTVSSQVSGTQNAVQSLGRRLGMGNGELLRDLKLEKTSGFAQTPLYQKLFALADQAAGERVSRERIPQIELISPKFTRTLTTEWFANRVNGRYESCMARAPS